MCGIFGYMGASKDKKRSINVCLQGLKNLEYRGYDSSGIAGVLDGSIKSCKQVGKVSLLETLLAKQELEMEGAIAHTRWATHGKPTKINAHPHADEKNTCAIVHNGIIENHHVLRNKFIDSGVTFQSETDTEVIAALISNHYQGDILSAVQKATQDLEGSFALAVIHRDHPNTLIVCAHESPLAVGLSKDRSESFIASDANAFKGYDVDVIFLKDGQIAKVTANTAEMFEANGAPLKIEPINLNLASETISKNGFDHFMLKEIHEQPQTIQDALEGRIDLEFGTAKFTELKNWVCDLQKSHHILILACGTSWHAGLLAASLFEDLARIPTQAEIASEFRYTNPLISEDTLVIAVSQSGETADTLAAVREAKAKGAKVIGFCNVPHSTLTREADETIFLRAGQEISVCSTKAFTSQLCVLSLFALHMARIRHLSKEEGQSFLQDLIKLPTKVKQVLAKSKDIEAFAKKYSSFEHFFFLGRRYMFPTCLEAALKLKEITYLNAGGYPAGEMKHGPIALVNPALAVIALCGNTQTKEKMHSNLMEVKSRGSPMLAFAQDDDEYIGDITSDVLYLPKSSDLLAPIEYSVALQLFAYYVAVQRGLSEDIDTPQNLAKSVTVE